MKPTRPKWEMADVVERFRPLYLSGRQVPFSHLKVLQNIVDCRTAALGGHVENCDQCEFERYSYNSCRDRHCPKCQTMTKENWLDARRADLLPVAYFHNVFTLPHELNQLVLHNKKAMLNLLFKAVAQTLLSFGLDERSGPTGKPGFTLILHTWNQKLLDHFHIHCVIPAGVLEDEIWKSAKSDRYLFSVKALSKVFKNKYMEMLRKLYDSEELVLPKTMADLSSPTFYQHFEDCLLLKPWVVYSKRAFGGPEQVLNYLGRYTHRIAISNHRIVSVDEKNVTFTCRDNKNPEKDILVTLSGDDFLKRFLLHTLPSGFMRIRHYGFLSSRSKKKDLEKCRKALDSEAPPQAQKLSAIDRMKALTGIDLLKCPKCSNGHMKVTRTLPRPNGRLRRERITRGVKSCFLDSS